MSPPDLPRDAPIFDVPHPAQIVIRPAFWDDPDASLFDRFDSGIGKWLES